MIEAMTQETHQLENENMERILNFVANLTFRLTEQRDIENFYEL